MNHVENVQMADHNHPPCFPGYVACINCGREDFVLMCVHLLSKIIPCDMFFWFDLFCTSLFLQTCCYQYVRQFEISILGNFHYSPGKAWSQAENLKGKGLLIPAQVCGFDSAIGLRLFGVKIRMCVSTIFPHCWTATIQIESMLIFWLQWFFKRSCNRYKIWFIEHLSSFGVNNSSLKDHSSYPNTQTKTNTWWSMDIVEEFLELGRDVSWQLTCWNLTQFEVYHDPNESFP